MRMQAYIRVCSDESVVRAIHRETNLPGATIKQRKAEAQSADGNCWNWQTERVPINIDEIDGDLQSLLSAHRQIFPMINKHRDSELDVYLEIITKYEDGEDPHGLFLSDKTIALLAELGGAVDHDVEAYGLLLRKRCMEPPSK